MFLFSLIGTFIVELLGINFPGSIVGLLLLLILMMLHIIPEALIKDGAGFILAFLPLFFIPATVGVMNFPELLSFQGLLLLVAVIISTILTIILSGKLCQYIEENEIRKESI